MHTITLPYYRFFRENTLRPILSNAESVETGLEDEGIRQMLASWRERKLYELYFVQVAV